MTALAVRSYRLAWLEVNLYTDHRGVGKRTRHLGVIVAELVQPVFEGEVNVRHMRLAEQQLAEVEVELRPSQDFGHGLRAEAVLALGQHKVGEPAEVERQASEAEREQPDRLEFARSGKVHRASLFAREGNTVVVPFMRQMDPDIKEAGWDREVEVGTGDDQLLFRRERRVLGVEVHTRFDVDRIEGPDFRIDAE